MRLFSLILLAFVLSSCGKPKPSASASASVEPPPAFKIAEEQRRQLERAKALEQQVKKAADERKKEIEEATR